MYAMRPTLPMAEELPRRGIDCQCGPASRESAWAPARRAPATTDASANSAAATSTIAPPAASAHCRAATSPSTADTTPDGDRAEQRAAERAGEEPAGRDRAAP